MSAASTKPKTNVIEEEVDAQVTVPAAAPTSDPAIIKVAVDEKKTEPSDLPPKGSKVTVHKVSSEAEENLPVVTKTATGWEILIKNPDGTQRTIVVPKKTAGTAGNTNDPEGGEEQPVSWKTMTRQMRIWTIVQHMLTGLTSIVVIFVMVLTLLTYRNSQQVAGAWPQNPLLTPTILMLAAATISLLADAVNLCFQCCGTRTTAYASKISGYIKTGCNGLQTVLNAAGSGFFKWAEQNSGARDLWGFSCTDAADAMATVNASETLCTTNTAAWYLHLASTILQVLSILLFLFKYWKPNGKQMTGTTAEARSLIAAEKDVAGMVM